MEPAPITPETTGARFRLREWTPGLVDALIAAAFVALVIAEAAFGPVDSPVLHATVGGTAMAALAWRRIFPVTVAVVLMSALLLADPGDQFSPLLALVLVSFTVGAETDPPRSHLGLAVIGLTFLGALATEGLEPSDVAAAMVFIGGPWLVGTLLRQRSRRAEEAVLRAGAVQEESRQREAAAVAEERTRIARELHDIVSHSISVVAIQTQAVRRKLGPDHAAEAKTLAAVEETAREALVEMRRLFGVLRAEGDRAALTPQPGLVELERLVASARDAGLDVEVRVEGEPRPLPPGVDLAAYRIIQEAVTNALRHSGGKRADVLVRYRPGGIDLVVEDDGHGVTAGSASGHGLLGIRERVHLYGGTLDVETASLGGVRVAARLPTEEVR